jgi:vacuolar-type H+-ATPase subunit E/Vma4
MESTRAITKVILKEAKKSVERIIQDAKQSVEDTVEKQRQRGINRANEAAQFIIKKAENEAEVIKLSITADVKMKANWTVLAKKEQWITTVLNETKNRLRILTQSKDYTPVLEKLITDAGIILGGKELEVLLNEQDSTLPLKMDKLSREISKGTGVETKLRFAKEKTKALGGPILRTIDGKVVMDNTFDDIFNRRERDMRYKIAKVLFK